MDTTCWAAGEPEDLGDKTKTSTRMRVIIMKVNRTSLYRFLLAWVRVRVRVRV